MGGTEDAIDGGEEKFEECWLTAGGIG